MNYIKDIFWNSQQKRVRAGYRLITGIFLYSVFSGILSSTLTSISGHKLSSEAPVWFFIIYACAQIFSAFGSIWIVGHFLDRRPFTDFGLNIDKSWWIDFGFGFVLGAVLMAAIFVAEYEAGWITVVSMYHVIDPELPFIIPLLVVFLVFIGVSFAEELLTRGYILKNLAEGFNFKSIGPKAAIVIAWLISSSIFGLAHLNNPNATWVSSFNITLAGILLGYGYVLTRQLSIPMGIHLSWNFFQGNVFGFPVSGMTLPSQFATFVEIEQSGPDIWTGGAFGPEAGLIGLCAMILGMVLMYFWVRARRTTGEKGINQSLAIYPGKTSEAQDIE